MSARAAWSAGWPAAAAIALAAAWPIAAYAVNPFVVPAIVVGLAGAAVVLVRPEYGVALTLALVPFWNLDVGLPLGLWLIPALTFGVLAYGALVSAGRPLVPRWLVGSLFAFVAASIASGAFALEPQKSVKGLFILGTAVALFLAVLEICRERRRLVAVAAGAVLALLLASAHGVLQHLAGGSAYGFVADGSLVARAHGAFVSPNKFGGFVAILTPLAAALLLSRSAPGRLRALSGLALALAVPALVLSYSRGSMVGIAVGSLAWLALVRPRALPVAAALVAAVAVGVAPSSLEQRFQSEGGGDALVERGDIWSAAVDIYAANPVLGVGVNNFSVAYARLPSTLSDASQRRLLDWEAGAPTIPFHAHNAYLNLLAEEGIVGLAAFLLFAAVAVGVVYRGSKVQDPLGRAIALGAGAGWATWAVRNLVDVALFEEATFVLLALTAVAAGFVALEREERSATASAP